MTKKKDKIWQIFDSGLCKSFFEEVNTSKKLMYLPVHAIETFFSCDDNFGVETLETQILEDGSQTLKHLVYLRAEICSHNADGHLAMCAKDVLTKKAIPLVLFFDYIHPWQEIGCLEDE